MVHNTRIITVSRHQPTSNPRPLRQEGLCGVAAQAYLDSILSGENKEEATAGATRAYITAFNKGERYEEGGACAAADKAWKESRRKGGKDQVLEATLAFISAWPGVKEGNPCAVSGTKYVKAVLAGKSHLEATTVSMRGFINAFKYSENITQSICKLWCKIYSWLTKEIHSNMLPVLMLPRLSLNLSQANPTLSLVLLSPLSRIRSLLEMDLFLLIRSAFLLWKPLLTQMLLEMTF